MSNEGEEDLFTLMQKQLGKGTPQVPEPTKEIKEDPPAQEQKPIKEPKKAPAEKPKTKKGVRKERKKEELEKELKDKVNKFKYSPEDRKLDKSGLIHKKILPRLKNNSSKIPITFLRKLEQDLQFILLKPEINKILALQKQIKQKNK